MSEAADRRHTLEECHRFFAVELNNTVWDMIDRGGWSPAEAIEMIRAAHASVYHWSQVGTAVNLARGEHLLSRTYAAAGRGAEALEHAQRCLEICERNGFGGFDLAFAAEAMARSHSLLGNREAFEVWLARATEHGNAITAETDRRAFFAELEKVPGMY